MSKKTVVVVVWFDILCVWVGKKLINNNKNHNINWTKKKVKLEINIGCNMFLVFETEMFIFNHSKFFHSNLAKQRKKSESISSFL